MYWLHENCGYKFIGPESYYRLTTQELRILRAGHDVTQREKQDRQKGVDPGDRQQLQEFDNKLQSDREALTN